MSLPFGRLQPIPMPQYRQQQQRQVPGVGLDMIPSMPQPQALGPQGTMAMGPGGLQPVSSPSAPPASHPAMGMMDPRLVVDGGSFVYRGGGSSPATPTAPQQQPRTGLDPRIAVDGGQFVYTGGNRPGTTTPPAVFGGGGPIAGGAIAGGAVAGQRTAGRGAPTGSGFNWTPDPVEPPVYGGGGGGSSSGGPRGLMLPNNTPSTAAQTNAGTSQSMGGGWWNNPLYSTQNAGGWWNDPTGAGQNMNRAMAQGGGGGGDQGFLGGYRSGGGGGGSGGGSNSGPMQQFIDAMNAANAANAKRANNINQGWSGLRNYAGGLLDQYSNQSRADTDTAYNNAMSKSMSNLVNSGLANSTVLADQYARNARDRSAAMNRVNDSVLGRRLDVELPLAEKQFGFNERIDQQGPDPRLFAQLAQGAAAASGGGGGGAFVDMSGMGFGGMPNFGYMPMPGGYRVGSQLQRGSRYVRPTYGTGTGGGVSGDMGGTHAGIFDWGLGGAGMGMEPSVFTPAIPTETAFRPGMDWGGDWNFGGARQDKPKYPWMY